MLFKKIDVYGQVVITILCFCTAVIAGKAYLLMSFYFAIGAWQIISTIIHLFFAKRMPLIDKRKNYQIILVAIAFIALISIFNENVLAILLFFLLFVSPFIASWYFVITQRELKIWEARAQIHFR